MRRKLEYLLRECGSHKEGCCDKQSLSQARVVRVERIENDALWQRYAARLQADSDARQHTLEEAPVGTRTRAGRSALELRPEACRPVRCDELAEEEAYLFHGTNVDAMSSISTSGFDPALSNPGSRYGRGAYFTDESCKAHQYACAAEDDLTGDDEGKVHCLLYCRVARGQALQYAPGVSDRLYGYLKGMQRPQPGDRIFEQRIQGEAAHRRWDTVDVQQNSATQVHRELVCYDSDRVYPEFAVFYRTDGPDEEATALVSRAVEGLDSVDELMGMLTAYRKRDRASRARDQEALESDSFMDSMWFMRQRRRKRMRRATFVCCQSMATQCEDAAKQLHRAKLLAPALADRLVSELRPG
jgi:hypothetical protein